MAFLLVAVGFADGARCPHRGLALMAADFDADGGRGFMTFTRHRSRAMKFATKADAFEFWKTTSKKFPVRPDGKPNRPLTALTASIVPEDDFS